MKVRKEKFGTSSVSVLVPETPLEAVEMLESFFLADFGQPDWDEKFITSHFKICKEQLKQMDYTCKLTLAPGERRIDMTKKDHGVIDHSKLKEKKIVVG